MIFETLTSSLPIDARETNIWFMKKWCLFYNQHDTKLYQVGKEIQDRKLQQPVAEIESLKL